MINAEEIKSSQRKILDEEAYAILQRIEREILNVSEEDPNSTSITYKVPYSQQKIILDLLTGFGYKSDLINSDSNIYTYRIYWSYNKD